MKILINNVVRDMTEEEIADFLRMKEETDEPVEGMTETEEKAMAYDILMGVAE